MIRVRLTWSTPCSVVLPHRTVNEVRGLVPTRGGGWLSRGLHVRLRGDRVKARINQLSQTPLAVPLLDGRLVPDPQGARIDGVLRADALPQAGSRAGHPQVDALLYR